MDKFDLFEEEITTILDNYALSRTVMRSLDGGSTKWQMAQKPKDRHGRYSWYIGKKKMMDDNHLDYSDLKVLLTKNCEIMFFIGFHTVKNIVDFLSIISNDNLFFENNGNNVSDSLETDCHFIMLHEPQQISKLLTCTV